MASEWYVQHGGKEHGPLTSTTLKKLASEGKITPATSVRLGAQGAWGPASRVQGLFGVAPSPAAKSAGTAPNPAALATPAAKSAAPAAKPKAPAAKPAPAPAEQDDPFFDLPPPGPPVANPIARVPVAAAVPLPRAVPSDGGSVTPKIIGGVAVILGTVALATCWLPVMGGLIGWTGIAMGGVGLITGAIGLVLAAQHKGSGLMLNISGTSSAAVGLVMSVVLGVAFGMFTSAPAPKPQPVVVAKAIPTPPVPTPIKRPEPAPEPVWTDAGQPIQQGDIKAAIVSVKIEQVRLEDITTMKRGKPQPMLKIKVAIENTSQDKIVEFPGWIGGGDLVGQGLGQLVGGEAGGALAQLAGSGAILADNVGNKYKQTPISLVFGGALTVNQDNSIRPGKVAEKELLFAPPLETIEYLRLELPSAGFSGTDSLRFQIPKAMVAGLVGENPAPPGSP
jgi:hypothetical protein